MLIESLPILILNPHNRCNCRCSMCDIWRTANVQEIAAEDLERQLDSIDQLRVQWVVFSGGEPLMHSHLWRLCAMLREREIRTTLLSSGLLLSRHATSIVEYFDDVIVSLDGPAEIHDRIRGIPRAFELLTVGAARIRALAPGFPISARCTVQRANAGHLVATVEAARQMNLNSISFLAADLESTAFSRPDSWPPERQAQVCLTCEEISLLDLEIEALIAAGECGCFVRESREKLRRIPHHFRAHLGDAIPITPTCNAPWVSAVVEADGTVRPCFFHRPIGKTGPGVTLAQVLNGPEGVAFRTSLDVRTNSVCRKCVCSLHWRPN
jgi:MoaA/NifB/PqqE/SkfB family radical SAM enzyme